MQVTEGMIEEASRSTQQSTKDPSKQIQFVDVKVGGQEYRGFADFGPKCAGMIDKVGHWVHLDWESYGPKKDIKAWAFIKAKEGLKGEDNAKFTPKDDQIAKLAISHDATELAAAWEEKHSTTPDLKPLIAAWSAFYHAIRQELGFEESNA